jgi:hypothetical protein
MESNSFQDLLSVRISNGNVNTGAFGEKMFFQYSLINDITPIMTSKIAFMSISIHFIQADWSGMFNFPIACHEFAHPHPHDMVDIKDHIIGVLKEKTNLNHPEVVARLGSLTYDGAKVNEAFAPNPEATGINRIERARRTAVTQEFKHVEESTCICHRLVKMESWILIVKPL